MRQAVFVVPGRLDARTGGSIYNQRMVAGLSALGWVIDVVELADDFPAPSAASVATAAKVFSAIPDRSIVIVDGLVFSAIADVVAALCERLRLVALVHMPLADEIGIDPATAKSRSAAEQRALSFASAVIVTGRSTAGTVASYGVAASRIAVVFPGIERAPVARGSGGADLQLLCVAALSAGKGHDVLFRALAANRQRRWHLVCVGSLTRAPQIADSSRAAVSALQISDRVTFTGELTGEALESQFDRADLFVLATRRETFGMAVAEALAHGIPVVTTTTGEMASLVGNDAGVLAPPGDESAFTKALTRVLADAAFRAKLHVGAAAARDRLQDWGEAASTMAAVLERLNDLRSGSQRRGSGPE